MYVTGATGFVGSYVVAEAVGRGHQVTAVVRPSSGGPLSADRAVSTVMVDLRSPRGLAESLAGADVVIHLAATKSGDFHTQFAGTVVATENLLTAMTEAGVGRLVGVSTFSVYDFLNAKPGTVLDESSPIDESPARRDEYARTKLIQERLYRDFGLAPDHRHVILRPGMIFGPGNLWHALLGVDVGPRFVRIGSRATLPITYVENCAEAIVIAAERLAESGGCVDGQVVNIVDDDLPTQRQYAELVASRVDTPATVVIPWPLLRIAAGLLDIGNRRLFDGRVKFPGIAVPDRLHARFKPLRYSNAKAKRLLGWTPRFGLAAAVDRSVAGRDPARPDPLRSQR